MVKEHGRRQVGDDGLLGVEPRAACGLDVRRPPAVGEDARDGLARADLAAVLSDDGRQRLDEVRRPALHDGHAFFHVGKGLQREGKHAACRDVRAEVEVEPPRGDQGAGLARGEVALSPSSRVEERTIFASSAISPKPFGGRGLAELEGGGGRGERGVVEGEEGFLEDLELLVERRPPLGVGGGVVGAEPLERLVGVGRDAEGGAVGEDVAVGLLGGGEAEPVPLEVALQLGVGGRGEEEVLVRRVDVVDEPGPGDLAALDGPADFFIPFQDEDAVARLC